MSSHLRVWRLGEADGRPILETLQRRGTREGPFPHLRTKKQGPENAWDQERQEKKEPRVQYLSLYSIVWLLGFWFFFFF